MTVQQAREAAKRLLKWHSMPYSYGSKVGKELADFILDHFPEDGEEKISLEWLRNEWGFDYIPEPPTICVPSWAVGRTDGSITTRHQARQLFQALGIKKRGEA